MKSQYLNTLQFQTHFLSTQKLASKKECDKAHIKSIYDPEPQVNHTVHCTMLSPSCTLPNF